MCELSSAWLISNLSAAITPLTSETQGDDAAAGAKAQALMASQIKGLPIKRAATTDDIANLVSFLVSRGSDCESLT